MRFQLFLLVGLAFLGVHMAAAQQSYTLMYKFEKGKVYRYADSMLVNSTQEMMGQEMKVTSNIFAVTRTEVADVKPDGNIVLLISSDSMRVAMKSPRGDTTMSPPELIGKRTRITVKPNGETVRREVVDSIKLAGMMRGMPQRELYRTQTLPGKPVAIGETWTSTRSDTTEAMGGKNISTITTEYKLAGKENIGGAECLKVSYTSKVAITGKGSMMNMEVFTEGTGKMSGAFLFNPNSGMLLTDEGKLTSEMTAALTGAQNMTIPISQVVTTKHMLLTK